MTSLRQSKDRVMLRRVLFWFGEAAGAVSLIWLAYAGLVLAGLHGGEMR